MAARSAPLRYRLVKLHAAASEFMHELLGSAQQAKAPASVSNSLSSAVQKANGVYQQPLTTTMYITGNAMSPTLNRRSEEDKDAVEKLVVRLLPRASSRNVLVGDVVAFTSPLAQPDDQHVMVRRVAAVNGQLMVSSDDSEEFAIPPNHCWVLADNPQLKPPEVIDSRTFGHIPFSSILGRVIYAGSSELDHGPVPNHPDSTSADEPIVDAEVDPDELFKD